MALSGFVTQDVPSLFPFGHTVSSKNLSDAEIAAQNDTAANAILIHIATRHFPVRQLNVRFDVRTGTALIEGIAANENTRAQVIACIECIDSVKRVEDRLCIEARQ